MKVLVLWADNRSTNLGVRVLAEGSAALARRSFGNDLDFTFQDPAGAETGVSLQRRAIQRDIGRTDGPIKEFLSEFDLIWDTGAGDSFTDIYGRGRIARILYVQRTAIAAGIPTIMGPQTIGPFSSHLISRVATRTMNRMSAVLTRDSASTSFARDHGVEPDSTATDVVFALEQPASHHQHDVLINVSGLLWSGDAHVDSMDYRKRVADLLTELNSAGRSVALLAHVIDNPFLDNDVRAIAEVQAQFDIPVVVPADLADARSHIAGANLVIASRMHACLNALSVGTPAVAWAYSRKFGPLFNDLGWTASIDLRSEQDPVARTLSLMGGGEIDSSRVVALRAVADERLSAAASRLRESLKFARPK
ncbi:MAG: polysaccharide pyruvyl transferase family protein [Aeromicrobium sp.]|uniref:polysaccharide pyruvyl transferase family protein n=1 Tax=Aeromicrobium sp. TaxID=1871063 RepID=UPI00261AE372|nr:polysaccharide pyruvyl transferase family protein [Aeromicrobium sp.]MDF1706240.1 polysaccharide pyruvyl transferase family protein [Aeromicrobium sp.]